MKFINISPKICGATAIALATLLEAAPSKAILYIDFIPLSPTQTRIQASGNLNRIFLGTNWTSDVNILAPAGNFSSSILRGANDALNFTYAFSPPPLRAPPPSPLFPTNWSSLSLNRNQQPFQLYRRK